MALTTHAMKAANIDDRNPEYYVAMDSEGRGYLAKREPVKEVKEEVKEEPKVEKRRKKK